MLQLKVGPSGIRGRVDRGLDLGQVIDMVSAFGTWLEGGPVLLARDTRPSSPMLAHAARSALAAAGCEVLDAGLCPTAVAQHEAQRRQTAGAISVTASHNDAGWNGLKLYGAAGRVLSTGEGEEVLDLWHQGEFTKARFDRLGAVRHLDDVIEGYLDDLLARIDVERIRRAHLRVVVDACNGAGAMVVHDLCRRLDVELIPISCEPSGIFPHPPDPTAANMAQVAAIVGPVSAHVGFGFSSDCERVSLVTEAGIALGSGATLPLLAEVLLAEEPGGGPIVVSVASDSRVERVGARHGRRVIRSGVGATAVLDRMAFEGAALGGESSGGVAIARIALALDGLAAMARLLQSLSSRGARELAESLPAVHTRSLAVPCPLSQAYSTVARLRTTAAGRVSDLDGVRVELDSGGWYFVRVSHTEPVIRVVCEAETAEAADALVVALQRQVRAAIGGE